MSDLVRSAGFTAYTIWIDGVDLFARFEADDTALAGRRMQAHPVCQQWLREMAPLMDVQNPLDPWKALTPVFNLR